MCNTYCNINDNIYGVVGSPEASRGVRLILSSAALIVEFASSPHVCVGLHPQSKGMWLHKLVLIMCNGLVSCPGLCASKDSSHQAHVLDFKHRRTKVLMMKPQTDEYRSLWVHFCGKQSTFLHSFQWKVGPFFPVNSQLFPQRCFFNVRYDQICKSTHVIHCVKVYVF